MSLKTDYLKGEIDGEKSKGDSVIDGLLGTGHYNPPSGSDRSEAYNSGFREGRK